MINISGVLEEYNPLQLHIRTHPCMCDKAKEHFFCVLNLYWITSKIMQMINKLILSSYMFCLNITYELKKKYFLKNITFTKYLHLPTKGK